MRTTSRRFLLASLSAAPAAVLAGALPSVALAALDGADAALIAQAALVKRLQRLHRASYAALSRKEDAIMQALGREPAKPSAASGHCSLQEHPVDSASGIKRSFTMTFTKAPPGDNEALRQHAEALAVWREREARLSQQAGVERTLRACRDLNEKLSDAVADLVTMRAATPHGLAAKAGALLALMEFDGDEVNDLAKSLANDAQRLGGQFDA